MTYMLNKWLINALKNRKIVLNLWFLKEMNLKTAKNCSREKSNTFVFQKIIVKKIFVLTIYSNFIYKKFKKKKIINKILYVQTYFVEYLYQIYMFKNIIGQLITNW